MKFSVEQIKQKDAGRRLVTIPRRSADKLGLSGGDLVRIENGEEVAFGRIWPPYPEDAETNIARLDSSLRKKVNASILDRVEIKQAEIKRAESVTLALPKEIRITGDAEGFVRMNTVGTVLRQGEEVSINIEDRSIDKETISLEITTITPPDCAVITESTKVDITETTQ